MSQLYLFKTRLISMMKILLLKLKLLYFIIIIVIQTIMKAYKFYSNFYSNLKAYKTNKTKYKGTNLSTF